MNIILLRIALPTPLRQLFDYIAPADCNKNSLSPGIRIKVPFRGRILIGILLEIVTETSVPIHKLKQALDILDNKPLIPEDILKLCGWAADYYHYSIGEALAAALPTWLRKGKKPALVREDYWQLTTLGHKSLKTLKRGVKQIALLNLFKESSVGLNSKKIKDAGFSKVILNSLIEKNLVTRADLSESDLSLSKSENVKIFSPDRTRVPDVLREKESLTLNIDQTTAVKAIKNAKNTFKVFLLDGVTGSGKTEVYLQAMNAFLDKQILVLIPEIGLTPQTIQRFRDRFNVPTVALHSGLSEKERLNGWLAAKSGEARIIIGTRSSIFTPLPELGLIIVDEEHDPSFKQQDTFRYHARDLAVMRGHNHHIPVVLGSATPSLETLHKVHLGRYEHLVLPHRAGNANLPQFQLINLCNQPLDNGLSQPLLNEMDIHLKRGDQVLLFLNRRGYAPVLMCHSCGWMALCKRCDKQMTYHKTPERLHCHHCDAQKKIFSTCEKCKATNLITFGLGTEKLEDTLKKRFPALSVARIDRDSTQKKGSMHKLLEQIQKNEHPILIGTQMIAKGHHFPNVTLVAIVDADSGFFSHDFRGIERMGQLIVQVAGRSGRAEKPGKVMIQTHHPDHPFLQQLIHENFQQFATTLLHERKKASLPPYFFFALFRAEAYDPHHATAFLQQIKNITPFSRESIQLLGPISAPMPRLAGRYRSQLLVQAAQRPLLQQYLKKLICEIEKIPKKHRVHWSLDVDPMEMY